MSRGFSICKNVTKLENFLGGGREREVIVIKYTPLDTVGSCINFAKLTKFDEK